MKCRNDHSYPNGLFGAKALQSKSFQIKVSEDFCECRFGSSDEAVLHSHWQLKQETQKPFWDLCMYVKSTKKHVYTKNICIYLHVQVSLFVPMRRIDRNS